MSALRILPGIALAVAHCAHAPSDPSTTPAAVQRPAMARPPVAAASKAALQPTAPSPTIDSALSTEAACRNLISAYAVARDRLDTEAYVALFAEKAEFVFGKNRVVGPAAIGALMQERAKGALTRHHMTTSHIEQLDAHHARGISYFMVFSEPAKNAQPLPMPSSGPQAVAEYHDRFVKVDGQWLFERREVKLVFVPAGRR
ncbi:MAG: nuclear transport factor 2 family protein [Myxococcota bacterium]